MKKWRQVGLIGLVMLLLTACQGKSAGNTTAENIKDMPYRIAMITDTNGVDDRSFNQSAWEGMQQWQKDHNFRSGAISYYQSHSANDFIPNINIAMVDHYNYIFGVGMLMINAIDQVAQYNPNQKFAIIDGYVDQPNVVSVNFLDNEAAYLAGVAAASTTETKKVGFIGGTQTEGIWRFEAGFVAGVKATDPSVQVDVQYADTFGDAGIGQQIANGMYSNGADIIYSAAGQTGNGAFTETRNRMEQGGKKLWMIGVDRDQSAEGKWSGGNFTLASTLKGVGASIRNLANRDMEKGDFPGGQTLSLGLKDGAVSLKDNQMSDKAKANVKAAEEKILSGEIKVPLKPDGK
ncbi:MAG: BMP family protein [Aerococcus sp.]|nr:BMP family protein [Aerococcus sp.]